MTQSLDIRRHPDGTLDVDFYRRQARRRRQRARRRMFRRCLLWIAAAPRAIVTAVSRRLDRSKPRGIRRADAYPAR